MRRVVAGIFALSVGLLSFGESADSASLTLGVESAGADETASDCVGFRKSDAEKGLVFEASSSCDQKLNCSPVVGAHVLDGQGQGDPAHARQPPFHPRRQRLDGRNRQCG